MSDNKVIYVTRALAFQIQFLKNLLMCDHANNYTKITFKIVFINKLLTRSLNQLEIEKIFLPASLTRTFPKLKFFITMLVFAAY